MTPGMEEARESVRTPTRSWRSTAAIAVAACVAALAADSLVPELHLWFGDLGVKARERRPLDPRVVLVDLESWPRPRGVLAAALRTVAEMKPRVIALDVLLDVTRDDPRQDRELADAIALCGRVVLPTAVEQPGAAGTPVPADLARTNAPAPTPLLPMFARAALGIGFANFEVDLDGVVRSLPLTYRTSDGSSAGGLQAFAAAAVSACAPELPASQSAWPREGSWQIDWCETARERLPVASMSRLLSDLEYRRAMDKLGFFRDRIVLIGYLGIRYVGDGFLTPLSTTAMDRTPGAVVHANVLSNLLTGDRLVEAGPVHVGALALLAALAGALMGRVRVGARMVLFQLLLLGGVLGLGVVSTAQRGVLLDVLPVTASAALALGMASLLSAQALMRLTLVRRVMALFGLAPSADVAVLNVASDGASEGGYIRYSIQLREGVGLGAPVTLFRTAVSADSHRRLLHRLDELLSPVSPTAPEEELIDLGLEIRSELLGRGVERALADLSVRNVHLELGLADLGIPWELANIAGRPLLERFGVSRSVVTERDGADWPVTPRGRHAREDREDGFLALIVANPRPLGPDWDPLPGAEDEALALAESLAPLSSEPSGLRVELLMGEAATRAAVVERLRSRTVDVLHFSGHATFDSQAGDSTGFLFPEGTLGAPALAELAREGSLPPVVFANACHTARGYEHAAGGDVSLLTSRLSLPAIFTAAGARLFVGCLWRVETQAAARFSLEFYGGLMAGATAGEAMQRARRAAANYWMTHAAYIMYGDPRLRLLAGALGARERGTR